MHSSMPCVDISRYHILTIIEFISELLRTNGRHALCILILVHGQNLDQFILGQLNLIPSLFSQYGYFQFMDL